MCTQYSIHYLYNNLVRYMGNPLAFNNQQVCKSLATDNYVAFPINLYTTQGYFLAQLNNQPSALSESLWSDTFNLWKTDIPIQLSAKVDPSSLDPINRDYSTLKNLKWNFIAKDLRNFRVENIPILPLEHVRYYLTSDDNLYDVPEVSDPNQINFGISPSGKWIVKYHILNNNGREYTSSQYSLPKLEELNPIVNSEGTRPLAEKKVREKIKSKNGSTSTNWNWVVGIATIGMILLIILVFMNFV